MFPTRPFTKRRVTEVIGESLALQRGQEVKDYTPLRFSRNVNERYTELCLQVFNELL